jgi:hypothetical protein
MARRRPSPPSRRRRPGGLRFEDKPFLLTGLQEMLARLPAPALLRPDLGTLRGQSLLDAVEKLEAEGVLVASGGALEHRDNADPRAAAFAELGIPHTDVAGPLRAAGWTRKDPRLCE